MAEPIEDRRKRKRDAGALDQSATIAGGLAVAVIAVGLLGPLAALVLSGPVQFGAGLVGIMLGASVIAAILIPVARRLKARAKELDDDILFRQIES